MAYRTTPPSGSDVAGSAFFKKFLGKAEAYISQPTLLKKLLTDAYTKASEKNELGSLAHEAWTTLQTLFRLIRASISGEYTGVPTPTIVGAIAVLIYFISPIDLIPDFIPVLGLLDDVALVAWFSASLKGEMDKFHEWELTRPTIASAADFTAEDMHGQPASESIKYAGLTRTPVATSATDAGLGSPDSSNSEPVHQAGPEDSPAGPTHTPIDLGDGTRDGSNGAIATGGNVR